MCSTILMPNDTIINNINETMNVSNMTILPGVSTSGKDRTLEQMLEAQIGANAFVEGMFVKNHVEKRKDLRRK